MIDVPNAPKLKSVSCNKRDASIHWEPMGDNRAPILRYTIQFNTSFTPDTWEIAYDSIPATDMTYTVSLTTYFEPSVCQHLSRVVGMTFIFF